MKHTVILSEIKISLGLDIVQKTYDIVSTFQQNVNVKMFNIHLCKSFNC